MDRARWMQHIAKLNCHLHAHTGTHLDQMLLRWKASALFGSVSHLDQLGALASHWSSSASRAQTQGAHTVASLMCMVAPCLSAKQRTSSLVNYRTLLGLVFIMQSTPLLNRGQSRLRPRFEQLAGGTGTRLWWMCRGNAEQSEARICHGDKPTSTCYRSGR